MIATCGPKSPAQLAGIKAGDKIVEIDGVKVGNQSELKHQLAPRYAGEKIDAGRDARRQARGAIARAGRQTSAVHPSVFGNSAAARCGTRR